MENFDKQSVGDLFKIICLVEFENQLKKNKRWFYITLCGLCLIFPIVMIYLIEAPVIMILIGNFILSKIIAKFFIGKQEKILDAVKEFCIKNNIDIPENI